MLHTVVALIANGEIEEDPSLVARMRTYPCLVAVNGGLRHCRTLGLYPDLYVGDLDSTPVELLRHFQEVPQCAFPPNKDKTDLELAIAHVFHEKSRVLTVFGALGKRTDHMLFNVHLLSRYPGKLFFETLHERLFVIDTHTDLTCLEGQTISLIPLNGPVCGVTTQGLTWELSNARLDKYSMSLSNIALQKHVKIAVEEGDLLCYCKYPFSG